MVIEYDETKLYNADIKLSYLDEYEGKDDTKRAIYHNFVRAAKLERDFNKDVYEMTDEEIEKVLRSVRLSSTASVILFYSQLNRYSLWVSNKYNVNHFTRFGGVSFSSIAEKYVMKPLNSYYTQQDLFEYYEKLENRVDIFTLQAIFEGIMGEGFKELLYAKREYFIKEDDKYYINIHDENGTFIRKLEISKFLYDLVDESDSATSYKISFGITSGGMSALIESPYIIKRHVNKRAKEDSYVGLAADAQYLNNSKMKAYKDVFYPEKITFNLIHRSGIMNYLYELIKDREEIQDTKNENRKYRKVTNADLTKIATRFGGYIYERDGEEIVVYTKVKMKIDKDFFKANYCDIEFVKN